MKDKEQVLGMAFALLLEQVKKSGIEDAYNSNSSEMAVRLTNQLLEEIDSPDQHHNMKDDKEYLTIKELEEFIDSTDFDKSKNN